MGRAKGTPISRRGLMHGSVCSVLASLLTEGVRPRPGAIADALPHVDWRCIEIDEEALTVRLADPQAKHARGGSAKGYVADRLCALLRDETSATGAVLSLGGNIALFGEKPNGEPWETGVRDPNDPGGDTADALEDTAAYFILQDGQTVESTRWQELTEFS